MGTFFSDTVYMTGFCSFRCCIPTDMALVSFSVVIHVVTGSRQSTSAAAVAGSNMPPLPSNVAARMTNQSLSSYYGAVAVYSSKLSRSRPVSVATYKPSSTGLLLL